ncbi:15161_t:CDS:2 [Entrophospora sp. SA101]|nr:22185_t:CDS:2 [Entrophospora sp. SA101]CAJ0765686.1 15161_t:CDS:2 [Entrophospora sp. SA101]
MPKENNNKNNKKDLSSNWVFTINKNYLLYDDDHNVVMNKFLQMNKFKYVIFSYERGNENNTEHIQGYLELTQNVPKSFFKSQLHIEKRSVRQNQAIDCVYKRGIYSNKYNTHIRGPYESGRKKYNGQVNDIYEIYQELKLNKKELLQQFNRRDLDYYPSSFILQYQNENKYKRIIDEDHYIIVFEKKTRELKTIFKYDILHEYFKEHKLEHEFRDLKHELLRKTINLKMKSKQHKNGEASKWTQLHPPIEDIKDEISITNRRLKFAKTLEYMKEYGIDNVRGGPHYELVFNSEIINIIKRQMDAAVEIEIEARVAAAERYPKNDFDIYNKNKDCLMLQRSPVTVTVEGVSTITIDPQTILRYNLTFEANQFSFDAPFCKLFNLACPLAPGPFSYTNTTNIPTAPGSSGKTVIIDEILNVIAPDNVTTIGCVQGSVTVVFP